MVNSTFQSDPCPPSPEKKIFLTLPYMRPNNFLNLQLKVRYTQTLQRVLRSYFSNPELHIFFVGNPFMVEALFTSQNYVSTPCFDRLRALRRAILSRQLVEEFLSYVRGQMAFHKRKGLKGKRAYHIIRILLELNRIIRGQDPVIAFPVREHATNYSWAWKIRIDHND